jgi:5-formyltetrahydrofolate cyclo-ligase
MEGKSFRLVKYRLPIKLKKFGVKEPNISNNFYKRIDLAVVPVIGMDSSFRRVGFGKGFYDRFFMGSGGIIEQVFFVGRRSCVYPKIITDDYDVEGHLYITPKQVLNKKRLNRLKYLEFRLPIRRIYDRRDFSIYSNCHFRCVG